MYSDRKKHIWPWFAIAAALLVAVFLIAGQIDPQRREIREEGAVAIRELIERTARQCYAVEGVYPPNLAYLEDHYGIEINKKDYFVNYEAFASNFPPSVLITPKGSTRASEILP